MDAERIARLEARLTALERRGNRLRRACVALLGLLTVVVVAGAQVINDSLEIKEQLLVKDRTGRVRFDLGVEKTRGLANGLVVYDAEGKRRVLLGVNDRGDAALWFYKANGDEVAHYP